MWELTAYWPKTSLHPLSQPRLKTATTRRSSASPPPLLCECLCLTCIKQLCVSPALCVQNSSMRSWCGGRRLSALTPPAERRQLWNASWCRKCSPWNVCSARCWKPSKGWTKTYMSLLGMLAVLLTQTLAHNYKVIDENCVTKMRNIVFIIILRMFFGPRHLVYGH